MSSMNSNDNRYPRDRSPPRHLDRFQNDQFERPSSRNTDYNSRAGATAGNGSTGSNVFSTSKDVPRGPKAFVDAPRGPSSSSRGRGGYAAASRGDYRASDYRDRDSRDLRESPPRGLDRDAGSWRDRDFDRRERRPSPLRSRFSQGEFRDGPYGDGGGRGRGGGARHFSFSNSSSDFRTGRGGTYPRARGKADWDYRDRRRDSFQDDRSSTGTYRPRSRSPQDYRWDVRDSIRDDRNLERRDPRGPDRIEEERPVDREIRDRERDAQRYKREQAGLPEDSRKTSATSTRPSSPHNVVTDESAIINRNYQDGPAREPARRLSTTAMHSSSRDYQHSDAHANRVASSRDRFDPGTSSPPRAPQVPAFGPQWNVWTAAGANLKSSQLIAKSPQTKAAAPLLPPSAPSHPAPAPSAPTPVLSAPQADSSSEPPRAPKAERRPESLANFPEKLTSGSTAVTREAKSNESQLPQTPPTRTSHGQPPRAPAADLIQPPSAQPRHNPMRNPPLAPRAEQPSPVQPSQHSAKSPPTSPAVSIPSGPRTVSASSSSPGPAIGVNVPTGPKAVRKQVVPALSSGPLVTSSNWQWNSNRNPSHGQNVKPLPAPLVPAKRGRSGGEERGLAITSKPEPEITASKQVLHPGQVEVQASISSRAEEKFNFEGHRRGRHSMSSDGKNRDPLLEEEDHMDLDEVDFEGHETKFEKEKALLEAKKIDLSSRYLRAATPLENLSILARVNIEDVPFREDPDSMDSKANSSTKQDRLITPKPDPNGYICSPLPDRSPPSNSPPPITSPEIRSLPYLNQGPPTPLSELDVFKDNVARYHSVKNPIMEILGQQFDEQTRCDEEIRAWYIRAYEPWRRYAEELDREPLEADEHEKDDALSVSISNEPLPVAQTPQVEGRKTRTAMAGGLTYEEVIRQSMELERLAQLKRDREVLSAAADYEREAEVPEMLTSDEKHKSNFNDTSLLRKPENAAEFYRLQPPKDDFTEEEHSVLVQNFRDYPKKWGKLAQALPGRTYKDCINHYYATKWSKEFKPARNVRRRVGRNKRSTPGVRPKANALISGLGGPRPDVYEGDEFAAPMVAVTDSGRPKRAAAPTFGDKEADDTFAPTLTPGKKGAKSDHNGLEGQIGEKAIRKPKNQKERAPRRSRNQSSIRNQSLSPERTDGEAQSVQAPGEIKLDAEMRAKELDGASVLASLQSGSANRGMLDNYPGYIKEDYADPRNLAPSQELRQSMPQQSQTTQLQHGPLKATQQQIPPFQGQPSPQQGTPPQQGGPTREKTSYWSVQEETKFPDLLKHYGTDWANIASYMETKTQAMVSPTPDLGTDLKAAKNKYQRMLKNGISNELQSMINRADERRDRGEDLGPPPALNTNIRRRIESSQPTAPRPLAPHTETMGSTEDGSRGSHETDVNSAEVRHQRARQSYQSIGIVPNMDDPAIDPSQSQAPSVLNQEQKVPPRSEHSRAQVSEVTNSSPSSSLIRSNSATMNTSLNSPGQIQGASVEGEPTSRPLERSGQPIWPSSGRRNESTPLLSSTSQRSHTTSTTTNLGLVGREDQTGNSSLSSPAVHHSSVPLQRAYINLEDEEYSRRPLPIPSHPTRAPYEAQLQPSGHSYPTDTQISRHRPSSVISQTPMATSSLPFDTEKSRITTVNASSQPTPSLSKPAEPRKTSNINALLNADNEDAPPKYYSRSSAANTPNAQTLFPFNSHGPPSRPASQTANCRDMNPLGRKDRVHEASVYNQETARQTSRNAFSSTAPSYADQSSYMPSATQQMPSSRIDRPPRDYELQSSLTYTQQGPTPRSDWSAPPLSRHQTYTPGPAAAHASQPNPRAIDRAGSTDPHSLLNGHHHSRSTMPRQARHDASSPPPSNMTGYRDAPITSRGSIQPHYERRTGYEPNPAHSSLPQHQPQPERPGAAHLLQTNQYTSRSPVGAVHSAQQLNQQAYTRNNASVLSPSISANTTSRQSQHRQASDSTALSNSNTGRPVEHERAYPSSSRLIDERQYRHIEQQSAYPPRPESTHPAHVNQYQSPSSSRPPALSSSYPQTHHQDRRSSYTGEENRRVHEYLPPGGLSTQDLHPTQARSGIYAGSSSMYDRELSKDRDGRIYGQIQDLSRGPGSSAAIPLEIHSRPSSTNPSQHQRAYLAHSRDSSSSYPLSQQQQQHRDYNSGHR